MRRRAVHLGFLHLITGCGEPDPHTRTCSDAPASSTRVCIDESWFELPRWSSSAALASDPTVTDPTTPTLLGAFSIDIYEVTNSEFDQFVRATGNPPIPDDCGMQEAVSPDDPLIPEVSGWVGGVAPADRLDHPVVCVSRAEALAFCAWRGGRLVSIFEFMRAARAPSPDRRRFPWGDAPPSAGIGPWPELPTDWHLDYAVVGAPSSVDVRTRAVESAPLGVSAAGVHGLAGNASELLAECSEDLYGLLTEAPVELVHPRRPAPATCVDGAVVGGSNWRSHVHRDAFGASAFNWAGTPFTAMGNSFVDASAVIGGIRRQGEPPAPAEDRSWRVGFRCAYDLE